MNAHMGSETLGSLNVADKKIRKMRISQKLTLVFLSIVLLIWAVGYFAVYTSQEALTQSIGESSVRMAREALDKVDRDIYCKIERWKSYIFANPILSETIAKSNQEFERLDNIQNYINEKDGEWTAAPEEIITPFMKEVINNELSQNIKRRIDFYKKEAGYKVFPEVFVTNKYGANVAQTGKTSDYYQADEEWWQNAKRDGLYAVDVAYDKSASVYSTDIGIRIDDEKGNFIGVIKLVLNIEEPISIVKEAQKSAEYETTQFKLLTEDGKLIYSTKEFEIFEDIPGELLSRFEESEHVHYFIEKGDKLGEGEELFVHAAHSNRFVRLQKYLQASFETQRRRGRNR